MDEKAEHGAEEKLEDAGERKGPPPVPEMAGAGIHEVIWAHVRLFSRRIVRSNFLGDGVSVAEREALEAAGVTTPMSQNYLAWRRALLWFGAVALGLSVLIGVFSRFEGLGDMPGVFQMVWALLFVAEVGACALGVMAALQWTQITATRQMARMSWFCLFLAPIALFMIPIVPFMDQEQFRNNPQGAVEVRAMFGGMYFILLAPKLISLFPAVIRSSLTLKTLLPESPMPGWIAVVVAPLYALFFIMLTVIAIQVNDALLVISMAALAAAPLLIVMSVNRLVTPSGEEETLANIKYVRKRIGAANLIGIVAGVLYGFQILKQFSIIDMLQFFGTVLASVFLLTVVAADLLIGVFRTAFLRENKLREGALVGVLGERFQDLESRGLTELRAGEEHMLKLLVGKLYKGGKDPDGP